ncbi:MAG: tetratricopeptide repeat protein [Planctomycetaceae bacterium]|jgi:tetratricopeptide (TPR) repeat protein|nr:tetratricopeptide repeat protein [Planctomycetaceae bacterium]
MSDILFTRFERAQLLMQTKRTTDAVKELRGIIDDAPDFAPAYALLAFCYVDEVKPPQDPLEIARRAVALDPENAFGHYVVSFILLLRKEYDDADAAIRKAIELDRNDPDYLAFRGVIFMSRNRREEAKQFFLEALAIDPEHHQSLTMLSQIESQLGNVEEAQRIAQLAVKNEPENAHAHIASGYSFIYSNQPKEAFEAFREALRLDSNNEGAREGLLQALQMHHFFYRGMFQFFAMMNRLSASMQWGLIVGFLIGYNILRRVMRHNPEWTPVILPLIILYLMFVFMSWFSSPITYFLLLFSRWGRLAMNIRQKLSGIVFATFLPLGILGIIFGKSEVVQITSFGVLLLIIPLTSTLQADDPKTRLIYGLYTLTMVGLIAASLVNSVFIIPVVLMFIGFQFLANYYAIRSTTPQ